MAKFWLFGKQEEPAEDFDADYDSMYYGGDINDIENKKNDEKKTNSDNLYYNNYDAPQSSDVRVVSEQPVAEKEMAVSPQKEEPVQIVKEYFMPSSYNHSTEIVGSLMEDRVVIVDVSELSKEDFIRVLDYTMGAMQAIGGQMQRIDRTVVVFFPECVDPEEIDIDELEEYVDPTQAEYIEDDEDEYGEDIEDIDNYNEEVDEDFD